MEEIRDFIRARGFKIYSYSLEGNDYQSEIRTLARSREEADENFRRMFIELPRETHTMSFGPNFDNAFVTAQRQPLSKEKFFATERAVAIKKEEIETFQPEEGEKIVERTNVYDHVIVVLRKSREPTVREFEHMTMFLLGGTR